MTGGRQWVIAQRAELSAMDCFVATLLAMTKLGRDLPTFVIASGATQSRDKVGGNGIYDQGKAP